MVKLDIKIDFEGNIEKELQNMKLKEMFCKHVIRHNPNVMQIKAERLYIESCKLGYNICEWGLHSGHPSDIQYHIGKIARMEKDNFNHALRIVVCKYDFCDNLVIWVDNLHSALKYIRQYGKDVRLRDVPFYIVDLSDYQYPSVRSCKGSLSEKYEDILGAVSCAYKRYRRSNSKELIEIGYKVEDFLSDNPELLKECDKNMAHIQTGDGNMNSLEKISHHSLKDISREEWENLEELLNDYKEGKCTGIKENSLLTFIIQQLRSDASVFMDIPGYIHNCPTFQNIVAPHNKQLERILFPARVKNKL